MGQIINNGKVTTLCNLRAVQNGGLHYTDVPDTDEMWLIDTSNSSKSSDGTGKYDAYIVGDNSHTAGYLADESRIKYINDPVDLSKYSDTIAMNTAIQNAINALIIPTHLSQLTPDTDHKTVSDEQISRWNEAAAGEGGTLIESSEDITVVNDLEQSINRLEFTDKQYNSLTHSGLGKVYLKKNIQTVHTSTTEVIFDSITADYARRDAYSAVWKVTHDATYKSLAEATDNTDAKAAANTAYDNAYNNAINDGKTTEEAIALGNVAYVTAYKNAVSSIEGKDTEIENNANTAANSAFETASAEAIAEIYPQVHQIKKHYIDGRIQGTGDNKYINITPEGRFSVSCFRVDAEAGSKYKIFATKSDSAGGVDWLPRFWMVTETPNEGDTTAKLIKAYKEDNLNIENTIIQEAAIIEVEQNCTIWINYIFYSEHTEPCKIERIYETQNTTEVNIPPVLTEPNTEYIIRYDYDLAGGMLEVPENSVLKFDGGSIANGYIKGNNASISAFPSDVVIPNITLTGSWKNTDYYAKWFGVAGNGVTDDTAVLQLMLDISEGINKKVNLIWSGYTYKTTHGLYIKSKTSIAGGTIIAEFENPLDWILQTRSFYTSGTTQTTLPPNHAYIASWQEFDGKGDSLNHITETHIEGLTLQGTLCKHMVIPEGGDETSEKVWDGTYCPIYGGLKLNGASCPTQNVTIRNTAIGIARGACLHSYDIHLDISARFLAYAARAMNTSVVINSYLNAWCNYYDSSKVNSYTPYYPEYQGFNRQPSLGGAWNDMIKYIEGNGGIDDGDGTEEALIKPKLCSVKMNYAGITFINTITDSGAEVGFAATNSTLVLEYPYFEGVNKCYVYAVLTRVSINMPEITSEAAEYDFIGSQCSFVLNNCSGRIGGTGGTDGENHKYRLDNSGDRVQILGPRPTNAPEDSRFVYLSADGGGEMNIESATGSTLEPLVGKYYKFTSTVSTLAITLPAMTNITSAKAICINFTVGDSPNITFTSTDNKPISYYENYGYESINSEYEVSCLFNGTKWIIANTVID